MGKNTRTRKNFMLPFTEPEKGNRQVSFLLPPMALLLSKFLLKSVIGSPVVLHTNLQVKYAFHNSWKGLKTQKRFAGTAKLCSAHERQTENRHTSNNKSNKITQK